MLFKAMMSRQIHRLALFLLNVACAFGALAAPGLQRYELKHPAMGTLFTISVYAENQKQAEQAADLAFKRIDDLEDTLSDYQADSELNSLCTNKPSQPVKISRDLFDVLWESRKFARLSDGAFDPTVGPYVRLWRFSRKRKALPSAAELEAARAAVGWRKLRLDRRKQTATLLAPNMRLDVGGIAKGYSADQALTILRAQGLSRALVAASGDIAVGDPPPAEEGWRVGLSIIGSRSNEVARTVVLRNAAVSTSGDAEQSIEIDGVRYSHIVSPFTGLGLTNRVQVSVIAPNATSTDALATALSVLGAERGLKVIEKLRDTSAIITCLDQGHVRVHSSKRFKLPDSK
jgi:thiamine biosynthesis lipoprotein